jgi:hypothetical protein
LTDVNSEPAFRGASTTAIALNPIGHRDFAVRGWHYLSLRCQRVHRIPRQRFVTIAKRPSCERGTAEASEDVLPDGESGKFLMRGTGQ